MRLILGGAAQGKLARAQALCGPDARVLDGVTAEVADLAGAAILDRFHLLVRREVERGGDAEALARRVLAANPGLTVVCDEVGMGVVPIDGFERAWREAVGRALCVLAAAAAPVERIVAGLPQTLKQG